MRRKSGIENVSFSVEETKGPANITEKKSGLIEGVELSESDADYLLPHFTLLVVGKPGSGKTTVIRNMMNSKQFYKKKFDHVLIISPSANKMEIPVKKENMRQNFSISWIEERLMEFNKKQANDIIQRLRDLDIIDKFDVNKLNGHLFDEIATDVTKNRPNQLRNIFEDKERFFTTGLFKQQDMLKHPAHKKGLLSKDKPLQHNLDHNLPAYVDEIHEKYVKKLPIGDRNSLRKNALIVLDDMVSDLKANEHNPMLTQLIFNRRHLMVNGTVSIIIVSQKYSMIPSRIRSNANWMILFKLNPIDAEAVYKDAVDWPIDLWVKLLEYVFGGVEKKSHNHLDIWIEHNKFFLNFKEIKLGKEGLTQTSNNGQKEKPKAAVTQPQRYHSDSDDHHQPR